MCDVDFVYAGREPEDVFQEEPWVAVTARMVGRSALDRWISGAGSTSINAGRSPRAGVPACLMGAYPGSSVAFIAQRSGFAQRRVVAPTPYLGASPDDATTDLFTEADFDPKTGTLTMFANGRGLADCGMSANWIWDGNAFRLSEMRLRDACGGMAAGNWPTLFGSR